MARLARIVIPGVAHHVTQRGNRRQPIFFNQDDYSHYLRLVKEGCEKARVRCLAWCLMENHVHLVLVPETPDGLRAALADAHRRYSAHVNKREDCTGYLFQGRFSSYPMDDAHLMAAVRYVELNPVRAGLVKAAADWGWSSAASHEAGKRAKGDALTDVAALGEHVPNWRAMLRHGLEAGGTDEAGETAIAEIEARISTGRPLATAEWIKAREAASGLAMAPRKRGRKPAAVK